MSYKIIKLKNIFDINKNVESHTNFKQELKEK